MRSTRTASNDAAGSTDFTMSCSVSPATETAVSASISTPVRSVVRTVAVISTAESASARSTTTDDNEIGWHRGTSSQVRFAAMMPAMRAVASASPLGRPSAPSSATTSAVVCRTPVATAVRVVCSLPETSTMRAAPCESRWVNCLVIRAIVCLVSANACGQSP